MADTSRTTIQVSQSTYRDTFAGCTDRNPDLCACANHEPPVCARCDQEIIDGQRVTNMLRWTVYDDDPESAEWDVETRHVTCPEVPRG